MVPSRTRSQPTRKDVMVKLGHKHNKACMFCGRKENSEQLYGFLYQLNDNIVVHYFCVLLSSKAIQRGGANDEGTWSFLGNDITRELQRASKVKCVYCYTAGANISCCSLDCDKEFHLPCGMENGSMHQFLSSHRSFCSQHKITQTVDLQALQDSAEVQCAICKDYVKATAESSSIWAPCCQRNSWFHRKCIQQLALSAGYFFKCPLCNNVKKFKASMLSLGIYIPRRDASWERVPNAYNELLERHSECDAEICLCRRAQKRKFQQDSGPWQLKLCYTCGSSGTHRACSMIKPGEQRWYCGQCQSITAGPSRPKLRRLNNIAVSTNSNADIARGDDETSTRELGKISCSMWHEERHKEDGIHNLDRLAM
ncbi:PHD finger protein 7-like [Adelges cooleyi]|uniref:PHD finger protein 7-like n=1 Tax=Adelges cooleyi TaxID=133065 RepID=UPI0021800A07|nr:PHD finger protein 7-like [Adelges cooleyi]